MQTTILTADNVREIVLRVGLDALMDETIARLTEAFRTFDPVNTVVPTRSGFKYEAPAMGLIEWMPCMRSGDKANIKIVGYHPSNGTHHDLPTILSTMSMYGVNDGHLQALMDATFVTALRTGAASAIASRVLAQPGAADLGLIGAGAQAVTQLHALSRIFPLRRVFVHDIDLAALASFESRVACLSLKAIEIVKAPPEAFLGEVDILCTATSVEIGAGPVFDDDGLRPHAHVNAVGSDFPGKTELPEALLRASLVCPDFAEQALKEGESQLLASDELGPELHQLVKQQDRYLAGRDRQTVFDSTGWAVEDMVCMELFLGYSREFGIGQELQLESMSSDHRSPYQFLFDARDETDRTGLKRVG